MLNRIKRAIFFITPSFILVWINFINLVLKYRTLDISPKSILNNTELESGVNIGGGVYIVDTKIGKRTYIVGSELGGIQSYIGSCTIGKYCSIAQNVSILDGAHDYSLITTYPFYSNEASPFYRQGMNNDKKIYKSSIGNDVWIGANVIIVGGVTIGHGAVVGAGSVVTKNIPAYGIAVGNPARVVKFRFDKKKIKALLKLKWWNWSESLLSRNINNIMSNSYLD